MHDTHPLNILHQIDIEVFQHLHEHGITFDFKVENYFSDMTLKYSIDFLNGTERGQVMLDEEGKKQFINRMNYCFMLEPERYDRPRNTLIMQEGKHVNFI